MPESSVVVCSLTKLQFQVTSHGRYIITLCACHCAPFSIDWSGSCVAATTAGLCNSPPSSSSSYIYNSQRLMMMLLLTFFAIIMVLIVHILSPAVESTVDSTSISGSPAARSDTQTRYSRAAHICRPCRTIGWFKLLECKPSKLCDVNSQ